MNDNTVGTLTISLSALAANYRALAAIAPQSQTAAAVKADAYGLGMAQIAPALAAAGCRFFYVAHMAEGIALRRTVPQATIAVLHGIAGSDSDIALKYNLIPVLCDLEAIRDWSVLAEHLGQKLPVIIHLDTGMNRLGLPYNEIMQLTAHPEWLVGLEILFWLSHLACADEVVRLDSPPLEGGAGGGVGRSQNDDGGFRNSTGYSPIFPEQLLRKQPLPLPQGEGSISPHPMNHEQLVTLHGYLENLPAAPVSLANSSGIFLGEDYHFDQTRPGAGLYGLNPTPDKPNPMQPVIQLKAPVLRLTPINEGSSVGYSASWHSKRLGKLAVLPVGYADGIFRTLGNRGMVHFGVHAAPIVGRVSMDLITVDVTDVPEALCQPGCWATLIGAQQDVDTIAAQAGTIGYEVLTNLGARYRRVYE